MLLTAAIRRGVVPGTSCRIETRAETHDPSTSVRRIASTAGQVRALHPVQRGQFPGSGSESRPGPSPAKTPNPGNDLRLPLICTLIPLPHESGQRTARRPVKS